MIFDKDPFTGVTTYFDYDNLSGQSILSYEQDVKPALDRAAELRARPDRAKKGIKNDWLHYAIVPVVIQYEMLHKHGVDYGNPEHGAAVLKLLNTEYSRFKTTEITHNIKNGS